MKTVKGILDECDNSNDGFQEIAEWLFLEFKITDKIVEEFEKHLNLETGEEFISMHSKVGYLGHLVQLANEILESFKIDKFSESIMSTLENNFKWRTFCEDTLQTVNSL